MRNRRRLANKMTIMVCAVLIAVSAFFYAPMETYASETATTETVKETFVFDGTFTHCESGNTSKAAGKTFYLNIGYISLNGSERNGKEFDANTTYTFLKDESSVDFTYSYGSLPTSDSYKIYVNDGNTFRTSTPSFYIYYVNDVHYSNNPTFTGDIPLKDIFDFQCDNSCVLKDGDGDGTCRYYYDITVNYTFTCTVSYEVPLTDGSYNDGYADGYQDGFQAGVDSVDTDSYYQNGYDAGYADGEASGQTNGYNSGFQAGVDSVDTDSYYQNGYDTGYDAGYDSGYDTGYDAGIDSVDTDSYYQDGFQAGVDSVDTDSYYQNGYDAGYDAGYDLAYDAGYDVGYDAGWSAYEARVSEWGADTSEYPKLLTTKTMSRWGNSSEVQAGVVTDVNASLSVDSGIDVNHNHTYRFDISVTDYDVTGSSYIDPPVNHDLYFYVGSNEFYLISQNRTSCNQTLYVNGSTMSDVFGFIGKAYNVHVLDTQTTDQLVYTYFGYTVEIYDMGPTGDTQNHIANQTDKLNENADKNTDKILNSWDSSKGNKVQSDLDTGLNEYQTAEDSLWVSATTGMKDFTFFDFESVPAMITGLSFVTSIMNRWFESAGGASGVGIVLSVLFSVMLVSMVLGLYRMYQSAGHRSEVRQRRESRKKGK